MEELWKNLVESVTREKVLQTVIAFVVYYVLARVVLKILKTALMRSKLDKALKGFVLSVCRVGVYLLMSMLVAETMGISITSLLAVFSVAGLAVSLSVQNTLTNLMGGVMLLVSKPFAAGHYIEAGGVGGTVQEIGLVYTRISTPDNKIIYIPNSEISASRIVNYSAEETRRVDMTFSASYDDAPEVVKAALQKAIQAQPQVLADPAPAVVLSKYGDSAIEYAVRVWVKSADYWPVNFALNDEVKKCFDEAGVEMTYPHLNVHLMDKSAEK